MAEFTPITTQEQLEAILAEKLKEMEKGASKELEELREKAGKIPELEKALENAKEKVAGHEKETGELRAKIKGYETNAVKTRIAHEVGIPYELAGRLSGEDEESIRKDAENMMKLVGRKPTAPLADPEGIVKDKDEELRKMLNELDGKGE